MPITGVGRYSELLRRLLDVPGGSPAIGREISPDLVPVIALEVERPEWSFLKGERLASGTGAIGGAVATRATVRLLNPAGSGMLVVLEEVWVQGEETSFFVTLRWNPTTVTGEAVSAGTRVLDGRWGADTQPAASVRTNNTLSDGGTGGTNFARIPLISNVAAGGNGSTQFAARLSVVLGPGDSIMTVPGADDVNNTTTFLWRERTVPPVERTT